MMFVRSEIPPWQLPALAPAIASRLPPLTLRALGHVAPLPAGSILADFPTTRGDPHAAGSRISIGRPQRGYRVGPVAEVAPQPATTWLSGVRWLSRAR